MNFNQFHRTERVTFFSVQLANGNAFIADTMTFFNELFFRFNLKRRSERKNDLQRNIQCLLFKQMIVQLDVKKQRKNTNHISRTNDTRALNAHRAKQTLNRKM